MTTRERLTDALPLLGHRATGSSLPTRPVIHLDEELPFVCEPDAAGITE
jgi:hypothetical protein